MKVTYDSNGLVPMIIQDAITGAVLSLFYANSEAIQKMISTRRVWRYSRSKEKLMEKGQESGNYQEIISIMPDCDSDALLIKVKPLGPACHTGNYSCFGEETSENILQQLTAIIKDRKINPRKESYTSSIVSNREKIIEKLREECEELIDAKKSSDIKWETADLLYFILVYLENREILLQDVFDELRRRRRDNDG